MVRRLREEPRVAQLEVDVPKFSLSRENKADLFTSFCYHILFMRCQIPIPFAQLQKIQENENENQTFKERSQRRKTIKYINEVTKIIDSMKYMFLNSLSVPDSASIMLGASAQSPREMFTLHFTSSDAGPDESDNDSTTKTTTKRMEAIRRRMLQVLVSEWMGGEGKTCLLNVFMAVHLPSIPSGVPPLFSLSIASESLRMRESFHPKLRRCAPPRLLCNIVESTSELDSDSDSVIDSDNEKVGEERGVWFVSNRAVKALRIPGNKP